jgi:ABC-type phosphate/phosphonate transport system substrate-binding protein
MERPLRLGAVAYDPKVVPIWDGIRDYLNGAGASMDYVLFSNYEAQVDALLEGFIDIAWNTNLAYVRAHRRTNGGVRAIAMRDTDLDFASVIVAGTWGADSLDDLKGRTLALGSRDSGHAAILPLYFLAHEGIDWRKDVQLKRFDLDVGKHGDTGASEQAVLQAVASGEADAGAVGAPFWAMTIENRAVDPDRVRLLWMTPSYHHCNFTVRETTPEARTAPWVDALLRMDYNDPNHRRLLDLEGLKKWVPGSEVGYRTLFEAVEEQGIE